MLLPRQPRLEPGEEPVVEATPQLWLPLEPPQRPLVRVALLLLLPPVLVPRVFGPVLRVVNCLVNARRYLMSPFGSHWCNPN